MLELAAILHFALPYFQLLISVPKHRSWVTEVFIFQYWPQEFFNLSLHRPLQDCRFFCFFFIKVTCIFFGVFRNIVLPYLGRCTLESLIIFPDPYPVETRLREIAPILFRNRNIRCFVFHKLMTPVVMFLVSLVSEKCGTEVRIRTKSIS